MISKAFVQQQGNNKLGIEEAMVSRELISRGIEVELFSKKMISRRALPLSKNTLVVGDMDVMYGALKQLDVEIPIANSYPPSLNYLLFRNIRKGTILDLECLLRDGSDPIFVKPAGTQKRFTGRIFESEQDLYFVGSVSRKQKVWFSDTVSFVSEFRVYVVDSVSRCIAPYEGDYNIGVRKEAILTAIEKLDSYNESMAGYAIDFGVLDTGETALIEMNDGFAVGAYDGISGKDYTDMLLARWLELTDQ